MSGTILLALVVLVIAVGLIVFRSLPAIKAYFDYRGTRLIKCPETNHPAAIDVAAGEAAIGSFLSEPTLCLKHCSRWPERQDCGQECLHQIEVDPENCLVWNIVARWYHGKKCAICQRSIGELHHLDHAPGLLSPDHKTIEWKELEPELLPEVFATHRPVCWNRHVAELFRRMHPELVVDREPEPRRLH